MVFPFLWIFVIASVKNKITKIFANSPGWNEKNPISNQLVAPFIGFVNKTKNVELDEEEDEDVNNKMDMIANDMVVNDMIEAAKDDNSDEEDENKFFEKYKNCTCCKGYVYKCNGDTCKSLGQCYCKMSDECENDGK